MVFQTSKTEQIIKHKNELTSFFLAISEVYVTYRFVTFSVHVPFQ